MSAVMAHSLIRWTGGKGELRHTCEVPGCLWELLVILYHRLPGVCHCHCFRKTPASVRAAAGGLRPGLQKQGLQRRTS
uniref:Uncharacterized protein n=1 Tax=Anguilla anguilla TaxID=7936 RepID=A0A0E9Q5W8_ANGAN